ncbi:daptide-type RiPP biosynthesis aminotransferase [Kitasatospora sp. NPDC058201]|uniref:daptide-type RiPP biosynthesis aminotransferase n=1 Tax=Streptomycetaceae TaxID=2062 RepID=UPI002E7A85D3|nr:daptide-type RiPP biosynthesis aminotransferase [Streptomyces sp. BE303]MED7952556.1 aminotransferase class III-fold pyridoxal phosphate-dependent enzyme [Streptomyces sp. BE303]
MGTDSARYPLWELLERPSTFGRASHTAVRAEGTRVLFADGQWRQCATSGLWNVNLGYGNPRIADAVRTALIETSYFSLFRAGHEPAVAASRALLDVCGPEHFGRVLHSTSGSAANDLTMKLARQYWSLHRQFRRRVVVGLKGSYHGLTYGSHALTGMSLGQSYYSVDQRLIRHVSHEDPAELEELLRTEGDSIAAVVVEPVLGTGALPLPDTMLAALARLRREYGFLLVADEVATGFGRTGSYFASQNWPEPPDVLLASKGLTNGTCAAAAVVVSHAICDVFDRADSALTHAETQAGAPPTCAAMLATIDEMARLDAVGRAGRVSAKLDGLLAELTAHPLVADDNGLGCFRALRLSADGADLSESVLGRVVDEIRQAGALVSAGPSRIQLAPALVYRDEDVESLAAALRTGLDRAAEWLLAPAAGRP